MMVGGRSFDRLRMKGKGLRMMVGGRSFDRLRMKSKGLGMMVGGKNEINQDAIALGGSSSVLPPIGGQVRIWGALR